MKGYLFGVLVLKGLVVFIELFNFSFFSVTGWGIGFDYRDIELFALEMNINHSVNFEIVPKYCIQTILLTIKDTSLLLMDPCPQ